MAIIQTITITYMTRISEIEGGQQNSFPKQLITCRPAVLHVDDQLSAERELACASKLVQAGCSSGSGPTADKFCWRAVAHDARGPPATTKPRILSE
jgi:hypothetical protein